MEKAIEELCISLDVLAANVISIWNSDASYNQAFGWTGAGINRHDLASFASNLATDLRDPNLVFTPTQLDIATRIKPNIDILRANTLPQMLNANVGQSIPAYINTINFLRNQLLPRLISKPLDWANVEDAKQLPLSIVRRANAADKQLSKYEPQISQVSEKIEKINEAYNVSDDLPIVLDQLNEAKAAYLEATKEINTLLAGAKLSEKEVKGLHIAMAASKVEAEKIVKKCEEAYKNATSIGLAGAFEDKARSLSWSMRWWAVILISALACGAAIGLHNFDILNTALNDKTNTWPIIVLKSVFSLLGLGAPLWLAWLATKNVGQRFRLAEDYAFKATISKAYEGYRQEAARIDTAFESKLFGSALTRLDEAPLRLVESHSHNSPLHELVNSEGLQKLAAMFPDKESFNNVMSTLSDLAKSGAKTATDAVKPDIKPAVETKTADPV